MATLIKPQRHRARFHHLTVSAVERLTDDAVAVSFAVPDELAQEYAFEPGQHLTLRATINGALETVHRKAVELRELDHEQDGLPVLVERHLQSHAMDVWKVNAFDFARRIDELRCYSLNPLTRVRLRNHSGDEFHTGFFQGFLHGGDRCLSYLDGADRLCCKVAIGSR